MTDKLFYDIYSSALEVTDPDAFASDWALSSEWGDEADGDALVERAKLCERIYELAHLTVADVRHHAGLSQSEFATRFCIPYSTVKNWEFRGGVAPYIVLLLARACGMTEGVK